MTTEEMKDLGNMLAEEILYKYSSLFVKRYFILDDDLFFYTCETCQSEAGFHFQAIRRADGQTLANYYWCQDCLYVHLLIVILLYEQ